MTQLIHEQKPSNTPSVELRAGTVFVPCAICRSPVSMMAERGTASASLRVRRIETRTNIPGFSDPFGLGTTMRTFPVLVSGENVG